MITVYDGTQDTSVVSATDAAEAALVAYNASKAPSLPSVERVTIPQAPELIGVDERVYTQISAAINSGKRHLMFYGPPGTGKTEIAKYVSDVISQKKSYVLVTGSSDWTSQDLIGGYQPMGGGEIAFVPGILLRHFDRPFIIDELNRCDIDKVLGPLFTVLSEGSTTLPYRVDVTKRDSPQYQILGSFNPEVKDPIFSPDPGWRLIATINTVDKSSLYQMSYALSRRFAWIFVDVPTNLDVFVRTFVTSRKHKTITGQDSDPTVLGRVWKAVNAVRPLGAAPFIDAIAYCLALDDQFDFGAAAGTEHSDPLTYLDAFKVHIMPMLDGGARDAMEALSKVVCEAFGVVGAPAEALHQQLPSIAL